jgi:hypothetical protein
MIRALEHEGLAAVYSRHRSVRPRPTPELVLTHERVIEAIMARGGVLPLRFGAVLDRVQALSDVLAERRTELMSALSYVRGRVELGLRVTPRHRTSTDPRAQSGREYLMARINEHQQAELAAREIHAPLRALAAASVVREHVVSPAVLAAAYLVEAGGVQAFRHHGAAIAERYQDMHISVTGPWPPYSFVDGHDRR